MAWHGRAQCNNFCLITWIKVTSYLLYLQGSAQMQFSAHFWPQTSSEHKYQSHHSLHPSDEGLIESKHHSSGPFPV